MSYLSPGRPRAFGHRGACGLAPENTLASFALAATFGVDYLELDVHGTTDGVVVVHHDDEVDRTTDGTGPIRERSWREVEALDAGYRFTMDGTSFPFRGHGTRIPTLESVLAAHPELRFNIEIKQGDPPIIEEVVSIVRSAGAAERTLLAAEHAPIMNDIRAVVGDEIVTGSSVDDVLAFYTHMEEGTLSSYRHPGVALQIPPDYDDRILVSPESVAAAHSIGVEIHVWTINGAAEIDRLLDAGADGIMSDFPGLVTEAIARRR